MPGCACCVIGLWKSSPCIGGCDESLDWARGVMGECTLSEGDRPLLAIPGIVEFERNVGKVSFVGADMGEPPWDGPPWGIPRCCCCCCIANACCGFMRFGVFMFPPEFRICCMSMSCRCWLRFMALMLLGICCVKLEAAMRGSTLGAL